MTSGPVWLDFAATRLSASNHLCGVFARFEYLPQKFMYRNTNHKIHIALTFLGTMIGR